MKHLTALVLLWLVSGIEVSSWAAEESTIKDTADMTVVVQGNTAFALSLYSQLRSQAGNLFFSPLSLSLALAMTYAGARGQTAEQMAATLHLPSDQQRLHSALAALSKDLLDGGEHRGYQLHIANALWYQQGYRLHEEFLRTAKAHYSAGLNGVDFRTAAEEARRTINAWVEQQTKDKIKDLIPPGTLDALTRLVLTNAIYFKGDWTQPFKKEHTKEEIFKETAVQQVTVPMMHQTEFFRYLDGGSFQALELPYVGDTLSMVVFLPKEVEGLAEFETSLTAEHLAERLSQLQRREVVVEFPKFTVTAAFQLAGVLSQMGMPLAFSEAADFSGMSEETGLDLSAVIHKAYVDVNEEGTEAAAATGVVARATAAGPPPVVFRADHPFVFFIQDARLGSILFLGRVIHP
ncbi:MAG: serpin family protein [Deltaproteobacteria bacterium]|nr:serpin family protein [Deltaproteobacteria bacterium]